MQAYDTHGSKFQCIIRLSPLTGINCVILRFVNNAESGWTHTNAVG
jgi:hypothetical protein